MLVVIVGPTASGKTALAIQMAQQFNGEIVNCDSVALYRDFDIGTAKPSMSERALVPHHLLDVADPAQAVTAGEYSRMARQVIHEIAQRGKLPIVAGGTGLYLRALLEGLFSGPPRSEPMRERLRALAEHRSSEYLWRILKRLDAASAAAIHRNDVPKLIRAVEVCLSTRRPMSKMWEQGRDPLRGFRILRIGLNPARDLLYQRINERAARMFDAGLVEETRRLRHLYRDAVPPICSLGYRQALQLLRGELNREQAVAAAQQAHRNYAKRQLTWFRREPDVHWLAGFGDDPATQEKAAREIAAVLAG
ncbi:MAG: tRNA (adenosine(37)-N6)-dimethylallyltransferase MiaA [Acidobacteriales bacterium]|nr:tRNA (adenosine(37)-N6)-dimethylallyltransferase MiaA [Terriglobales bacterium]